MAEKQNSYSYLAVRRLSTLPYLHGIDRMAVGTSQGEALLVDTRKGEAHFLCCLRDCLESTPPVGARIFDQVVAHAHPFPESEPVTCVSLCSESAYQERG